MQLKQLNFKQLARLHPKLTVQKKATGNLMYTAKIGDFCPAGLEKMLLLYPIHVVKQKEADNNYDVVAGLRQYELLSVYNALQDNKENVLQTINVIEHDKLTAREINTLAGCDIAGGALIFSLGAKIAAQLEIIKNSLDPEIVQLFPKYSSGRRMADRDNNEG